MKWTLYVSLLQYLEIYRSTLQKAKSSFISANNPFPSIPVSYFFSVENIVQTRSKLQCKSCCHQSRMKNKIEIASWTCHPTPFAGMHSFSCCTNSHKFHFKLSNCYNEIIDFHVIYDDMNNIFMEHPVDINYECNLKCISMHTFFPASCFSSSFRSRYTTMRKYIYVRRNFIFFFLLGTGREIRNWIYALWMLLCKKDFIAIWRK